jgi:hypothetical protein
MTYYVTLGKYSAHSVDWGFPWSQMLPMSRVNKSHIFRIRFKIFKRIFVSENEAVEFASLDTVKSLILEALCYKPEGRGFYSRLSHWIFKLT